VVDVRDDRDVAQVVTGAEGHRGAEPSGQG
jgi:hypothetical protein